VINSVAVFALSLKMDIPRINDSRSIVIRQGRHPLLQLALRKSGRDNQVVPLDMALGGDDTVMVITGSNAGGKTIAIKTIGLLLLMALSGMPVPADPSSSFPVVTGMLADIGDEQSIEENLSTFSAHISNISQILKKSGPWSLVLIDELGTGTDPEEGAALACAVLNVLKESGALVFATTHLADIKGYVHRTAGMVNASMEFDRETLLPLYKLRIGEPGQSHALETARRYGLPDSIIESAKSMLGGVKVEFDNLIADLNEKRAWHEREAAALELQRKELEEKNRVLEERLREAEEGRREILAGSYREAADVVTETKRQMHALLEELKRKEKAERKEVLREAEKRQRELSRKVREYGSDRGEALSIEDVREGDVVHVDSLGYDATVTKVMQAQQRLRVSAAGKEIEVPVSDVTMRTGKGVRPVAEKRPETGEETVPSRINLIGLRVDEALSQLEPFLNHASLAGFSEVTIIHGLGAGILARAVREHLAGHPLIKQFRPGEKSEGGNGVTVAVMT
jgi:DNA mismatch repair protein MutS2